MPEYKVHVRQWVEELGEATVEAEDATAVYALLEDEDADIEWLWTDGSGVEDFEIIRIEELE